MRQAEQLLTEAANAGAGLAVLPENFALMSESRAQRLATAEYDNDGAIQSAVRELARRLGIWVVAGTIPIRVADEERAAAACCVYDETGERVGRYDKIHLFDVSVPDDEESYAESAYTVPGSLPLSLMTPWGRLGVGVCYDLRFPEQFRQMATAGLDILALPAAFTVPTGKAHWEVLLRARAVENLCFVAAAAQVGRHPANRETWGHSMIVGPWGKVLADAADKVGVVSATFDPMLLESLRKEFPVLDHRVLNQ